MLLSCQKWLCSAYQEFRQTGLLHCADPWHASIKWKGNINPARRHWRLAIIVPDEIWVTDEAEFPGHRAGCALDDLRQYFTTRNAMDVDDAHEGVALGLLLLEKGIVEQQHARGRLAHGPAEHFLMIGIDK